MKKPMKTTHHRPGCWCEVCRMEHRKMARAAAKEKADERLALTAGSRFADTPETNAHLGSHANSPDDTAMWLEIGLPRQFERERNALREQMRNNPWCAACRESDCCISGDGTCAMIRKYLSSENAKVELQADNATPKTEKGN